MAIDKIQSESINLADNFDFTGNVTGAGGGKVIASYHTQTSSGSVSDGAFALQSNLTTSVTPASSSSKFLLTCGIQGKINASEGFGIKLQRDSTSILENGTWKNDTWYTGSGEVNLWSVKSFIDSPSTTSAIDYKVYVWTDGTVQIPNTSINYLTILELSS